jgi:hypothetical protein
MKTWMKLCGWMTNCLVLSAGLGCSGSPSVADAGGANPCEGVVCMVMSVSHDIGTCDSETGLGSNPLQAVKCN